LVALVLLPAGSLIIRVRGAQIGAKIFLKLTGLVSNVSETATLPPEKTLGHGVAFTIVGSSGKSVRHDDMGMMLLSPREDNRKVELAQKALLVTERRRGNEHVWSQILRRPEDCGIVELSRDTRHLR
jgi:hypothetical protein